MRPLSYRVINFSAYLRFSIFENVPRARGAELRFQQQVQKFQSLRPGFTYVLIPYRDPLVNYCRLENPEGRVSSARILRFRPFFKPIPIRNSPPDGDSDKSRPRSRASVFGNGSADRGILFPFFFPFYFFPR